MLGFPVRIQPGSPIYEQIVFAVKKALARGILKPGDKFPSVRTISRALKINPNTAQRAVADLTLQGILEVHPGRGSYLTDHLVTPSSGDLEQIEAIAEKLIIEADRLGIGEKELFDMLRRRRRELRRIEV